MILVWWVARWQLQVDWWQETSLREREREKKKDLPLKETPEHSGALASSSPRSKDGGSILVVQNYPWPLGRNQCAGSGGCVDGGRVGGGHVA